MKNTLFLKLFLMLGIFNLTFLFGQTPEIDWKKSFGGSNFDYANDIILTSEGNFMIAGITRSDDGDISHNIGGDDFWLIHMDSEGNLIWEKTFGGTDYDRASEVIETSDGNFVVVGLTWSDDVDVTENKGMSDVWIVKFDSEGNLIWEKSYGGSADESASSIEQTTDGGYIVVGSSRSNDGDLTSNKGDADVWILKLDSEGDLEWQKSYGGNDQDWAASVKQTTDGGYIVGGTSKSTNGDPIENKGWDDMWILKLDSSGEIEWQKIYGGSDYEVVNSVLQTEGGGYMVAGYTWSDDGDVSHQYGVRDIWVLKLDSEGSLIWEKTFGGSNEDTAYSIIPSVHGGFVLSGFSSSTDGDLTSNNGGSDFWIVKIDDAGNLEWQQSLGGSLQDWAYAAVEDNEGALVVVGHSASSDGDFSENKGQTDVWVVKFEASIIGISDHLNSNIEIFPNPTIDFLNLNLGTEIENVRISITNVSGRTMMNKDYKNVQNLTLDFQSYSSGIYFLNIENNTGIKKSLKILKN